MKTHAITLHVNRHYPILRYWDINMNRIRTTYPQNWFDVISFLDRKATRTESEIRSNEIYVQWIIKHG